jgi:hypothetical protein
MRRGVLVAVAFAATLGAAVLSSTAAASLVADYRFNGNFSSSVAGADDVFPNGDGTTFGPTSAAGCRRQALSFPAGHGLGMHTDELPPAGPYTLIVQVRFETVPVEDYVRVINWFPSFTNDNGLYLYDGKLDFYDTTAVESDHLGTTQVQPNQFVEIAVTRDASELLTGYVDGIPQFSYSDASDQAVSTHPVGNVYFFVDDADEESAGTVARLRVYNSALAADEITNTVGCFGRRCGGQLVSIDASDGEDLLFGTPGRDVIDGLGGDDTIRGLGGRDVLCGGAGRDRLIGGNGADRLLGGAEGDILLAGKGRDRLLGGSGPDRLLGGGGVDLCRGGPGRDARKGCERGRR